MSVVTLFSNASFSVFALFAGFSELVASCSKSSSVFTGVAGVVASGAAGGAGVLGGAAGALALAAAGAIADLVMQVEGHMGLQGLGLGEGVQVFHEGPAWQKEVEPMWGPGGAHEG